MSERFGKLGTSPPISGGRLPELLWPTPTKPRAMRRDGVFSGLWGLSKAKGEVVPTEVLVKHGLLARGSREADKKVWQDDGLNVRGAPERVACIRRGWGKRIDGCMGERKIDAGIMCCHQTKAFIWICSREA